MNGQIQYGSAPATTSRPTRAGGLRHLADPERFQSRRLSRPLTVSAVLAVVLAILLVAIPRQVPEAAVLIAVGAAWVSLMLAMMLPSRAQRAGNELTARLARFRHAVNAIGDSPTRQQLEDALALARRLNLRDDEIADETARVRASLVALTLREQLDLGGLPVIATGSPLRSGEMCHFSAPVRFGRRRSDDAGQLLLTDGWLKFCGTHDLSIGWTQVDAVRRADTDLLISLSDRDRGCRFAFRTAEEAARCGVIAAHLRDLAQFESMGTERARFAAVYPQ